MGVLLVSGPSNAGPGERDQMLTEAAKHFTTREVSRSEIVRIDVPGRGAGVQGEGSLRGELEPLIPLLQSGSLFGDRQGLELVDAHNLLAAEGDVIAALLADADLDSIEVVLVAGGALPKTLTSTVKEVGDTVSVRKMWDRQATQWLSSEVNRRGLTLEKGAEDAMLQRFGTDTAGMGQALDQLEESTGKITAELILDRFKNRPDEPTFYITDAISKGDVGTALRRLNDFLVHGHPLVYLAALESDLKKRTLAAAAPDEETYREWVGARSNDRSVARFWSRRGRVKDSNLRRAQEALVRADRTVKTQPEDVYKVTLERLTVALCLWYR